MNDPNGMREAVGHFSKGAFLHKGEMTNTPEKFKPTDHTIKWKPDKGMKVQMGSMSIDA